MSKASLLLVETGYTLLSFKVVGPLKVHVFKDVGGRTIRDVDLTSFWASHAKYKKLVMSTSRIVRPPTSLKTWTFSGPTTLKESKVYPVSTSNTDAWLIFRTLNPDWPGDTWPPLSNEVTSG